MILIEDTANGSALLAQAQYRLPYAVREIVPRGSKFERFRRHFKTIKLRRLVLPVTADWGPDWTDEIVAFPNGDYDDQVDALSMYLDFMATKPILTPPTGGGGLGAMVNSRRVGFGIPRDAGHSTPGFVAVSRTPPLFQPSAAPVNGGRSLASPPSMEVTTPLGPVIIRRR